MNDIPRYALLSGRKVRIISYQGDRKWLVLDRYDQKRIAHGSQLTFIRR